MKAVKKHLQYEAKTALQRAEHAEVSGRNAAKQAAEDFAHAENLRKQAAEFQRLADEQPE